MKFYVWHNSHRLDNRFPTEEAAQAFALAHCQDGEVVEVRDEAACLLWTSALPADAPSSGGEESAPPEGDELAIKEAIKAEQAEGGEARTMGFFAARPSGVMEEEE